MKPIHEALISIGLKKVVVLLLVGVLLVPASLSNSFAETVDDEIVWDMVVVGSPVCDAQHKELLITYSAITEEYLNLYELPNVQKNIDCITELEYENLTSNDDVDLLIVIFDETLAQKTMRSNVFDGFYLHTGNDRDQNHVIVMCHCSNFEIGHERKYTSWILTHELSHFVLSWQGYDYAAVERLVHVLENKYDHCTSIEGDYCTEQVYVSPPSLTVSYPVFPPMKMASGINSMQTVDSDVKNDEILVGFYKQVTQWWLNDMISNDAYLNATKQVFFSPLSLYSGMTIKDGMELPNGVIILDHAKEKPTNWKQVYYDETLTAEEEIRVLLSYVPQDIVNAEKTTIPYGEIPEYHKQRAQYWVDGKINDSKFFDSINRLVRMNTIPLQ